MRVLCYEYKKNSIVPWYLNPNFFKPDLFIVYTGNKYKNMIVDLDEKIRNLNWIFRLRVSTHTHCSKKMAKLCNHKMCGGVVFRVITSKVKNNIFLLKLLRNSPRHYSLLIALFSDFNTHYCEKSSNAITVILMVMVMMMHTAASTRIRRIVI